MSKILYLIGGLPNSGTSALAGSLFNCGLGMEFKEKTLKLFKGDESSGEKSDLSYDLYEIHAVMESNEKILRGLGNWGNLTRLICGSSGSMVNPPYPECIALDYMNASFILLMLERVPHFPFAIKDPRFVFLFKAWKTLIEAGGAIAVRPILSVRPPLEGARSLVKRRWVPSLAAGLELWLRYNLQVLRLCENEKALLVYYEDKSSMLEQVKKLCDHLDLDFSEKKVSEHLRFRPTQDNLDNSEFENHPLKSSLLELYETLKKKAVLSA